jgi:tetratricopeptide (TPR) repeat protein
MKRLIVIILLCLTALPVMCFGGDIYETRLNSGLRGTEAYSYLLMEKACENRAESVQLLKEAVKISPDLPPAYFALAKARFSPSSAGVFESVEYVIEGLSAYTRNFWYAFTLAGSLFFSIVLSFIVAMAVIVATRSPGDIQLFAHDLGEAKYLLFLLVLLIVISGMSPLLFIAGMLVLLGMYMKKLDRTVVYLFLAFLVFSPLLFRTTAMFLHTLTSSPLKAIAEVNESKDNTYALTVLNKSDDYPSLFSYALALKREGHYDEAVVVYQKLLRKRPDPDVYVNLGNCYVGLKNMREALASYLKALEIKPLASAYYNLSQISRESLDFQKGDEYFKQALAIDRDAVARYRSLYGRNPNRLVVDETLPLSDLWGFALLNTEKASAFGASILPPSFLSGAALLLVMLNFLMNTVIREKAYRCKRCNTILCPRCEHRLTWGSMCQACYASIVKLDELEVKERVSRLLSIYDHQKRRRNIMKILSFILPGVPQIYAGKILSGLLLLWPFLFFLILPFTNQVFAGGGIFFSHSFFSWTAIFFAALIYIISNIITRQRIVKGWL